MIRRLLLTLAALGTALAVAPGPKRPRPDSPVLLGPSSPRKLIEDIPETAQPGITVPLPMGYLTRIGDLRFRHKGDVFSLANHPNGKIVAASSSGEPFVREWDIPTGRERGRYLVEEKWHTGAHIIGYTADGQRLVTRIRNDLLTFDTQTRTVVSRIPLPVKWTMMQVVLSPVHRSAVIGDEMEGRVIVWDLDAGRITRVVEGFQKGTRISASFSPDGNRLAVDARSAGVFIASADGGPARRLPVAGLSSVWRTDWVQHDRLLVYEYAGPIALMNPDTGKQLARMEYNPGRWLGALARPPAGTRFTTALIGHELVTLDLNTLSTTASRPLRVPGGAKWLRFSSDGRIAVAAVGHTLRFHCTSTGESLHPQRDLSPIRPADSIQFSADGRQMLTVGNETSRLWDFPAGLAVSIVGHDLASEYHNYLSSEGRWVIGLASSRVAAWDATTGNEVFREPPYKASEGRKLIGFDSSGRIWVLEGGSGELRCHELPSGKIVQTLRGLPRTLTLAFSPYGQRLIAGSWNWFASRSIDPASDWVQERLSPPQDFQFLPCGLLLTRKDRLWTVLDPNNSLKVIALREDPTVPLYSVQNQVVSPDGRRFAFLIRDEGHCFEIRVWETAALSEAYRFRPPGGVTACAWTPDGRRMVLGHPDTSLTVWDFDAVESHALGTPAAAGDAWERLGSRDPKVGLVAVRELARSESAVPFLRGRFPNVDGGRLARLAVELGSPDFAVRDTASRELAAAGDAAEHELLKASSSADPEVRRRAEKLLNAHNPSGGAVPADRLRKVRAVEVLERVGTVEAQDVLRGWASHPGTLGAESAAALGRLATSSPGTP